MQRTYTAEQIADLASLMENDDQYTDDQKSGMRLMAAFLLRHAECSYEELREKMQNFRAPENRKQYPPFRTELVDGHKSQSV